LLHLHPYSLVAPYTNNNKMESVESIPAPPQPTSLPLPHPEAYAGEPREYARALMQRKDDIEKEIVSNQT